MKSSIWSVENWSSYRRVVRTNNDFKGWHRHLNQRCGRENLQLYVLIPHLFKEAQLVNLQLQLVAEHTLSSKQSPSSKDSQRRLHDLWNSYEEKAIATSKFLSSCISLVPF